MLRLPQCTANQICCYCHMFRDVEDAAAIVIAGAAVACVGIGTISIGNDDIHCVIQRRHRSAILSIYTSSVRGSDFGVVSRLSCIEVGRLPCLRLYAHHYLLDLGHDRCRIQHQPLVVPTHKSILNGLRKHHLLEEPGSVAVLLLDMSDQFSGNQIGGILLKLNDKPM